MEEEDGLSEEVDPLGMPMKMLTRTGMKLMCQIITNLTIIVAEKLLMCWTST